ncbi:hypothetical protein SAMN05660748_1070 [Blastococcus aggregatus]|uniref:Uncharacterized protein n=1 Tax=Blastococcus aggregatus TaxID=38502 RepID=A0A285V1A2_9ACTN|nr:hypothetical protein [Blastococcus aggregatus]SOC47842.1 hypothetical protein SAMN05660748_1070 [Blastococcus aggregatus]
MNDRITMIESIHARLTELSPEGTNVIDDPACISVLMSMTPDSEVTRNGDRWVESRSERLSAGHTVYAVISRQADGELRVAAHTDVWAANAERSRLNEVVLGRARGVRIRNMNALQLLHRIVVNEHGAVFHVGGLYLDAHSGRIVIDLLDLDEDDNPIPGTECGVYSLDGWEVH